MSVLFAGLMLPMLLAAELPASFHFKPRDHALGDVHPFFKDGECFLFSLKPGKYDSVLARSKDWLHWTETPITHETVTKTDQFAPYFVLGVFRDDAAGVYRSFYGHAQGRMVSSTSSDLLHWSCAPKEFSVPAADYYERRRDPFVFWIPEQKEYGCVMTTWMKGRPKVTGGTVSLATSSDLQHWEDHGPIINPGSIGEPECPQMFKLGERWYLLASIYDRAVGKPVYWRSDSPSGPWSAAPEGQLDGKDLCAAQIAFDGDTPLLFGWIPLNPAQPGKQSWGGHLALPREVYVMPDGMLGTRLPQKVSRAMAELPCTAVDEFAMPRTIAGEWNHLIAQFEMSVPAGEHTCKILVPPLGEIHVMSASLRIVDHEGQCWSERPVTWRAQGFITIQLFVEDNIIEVFADDRYSLAARLPRRPGKQKIAFETDGAPGQVRHLRLTEGTNLR